MLQSISLQSNTSLAVAAALILTGAALMLWYQSHRSRRRARKETSERFAAELTKSLPAIRTDIARIRAGLRILENKHDSDPEIPALLEKCRLVVSPEIDRGIRNLDSFDSTVVERLRPTVAAINAYNDQIDIFNGATADGSRGDARPRASVSRMLSGLLDIATIALDRLTGVPEQNRVRRKKSYTRSDLLSKS
jgi:hypothetical protein